MATPINSPLTGEIWHLSIDDLLEPVSQAPRLGGPGPFVINLSASTAPISQPSQGIVVCTQAHVYQIQRIEDRRMRYRLRLGPFASEDEADAVLKKVRDTYPSALTASAEPDDLRSIAALQAKADAQQKAALRAAEQAAAAKARWTPKPTPKPQMIPVLTEIAAVAPERPARAPAPAVVPTLAPALASAPAAAPTLAPAPAFVSAPAAAPTLAPAAAFASAPAAASTLAPSPAFVSAPAAAPTPAPALAPAPAAAPNSAPARMAAVAQRRELPRRGAAGKSLATSLPKFVAPAPKLPGIARKPAAAAAAAPPVAAPPIAAPSVAAAPVAAAPGSAPPVAAPPAVVPSAARHIEQLSTLLASLETTQTVRPLTLLELEDHDAARWFVIQLALADQALDPNTVPNLDIFSEYRLYSVAGIDQGRVMHALRLGFFTEEISAGAVASYLAVFFDKPTVKRVSAAERARFADERLEARKDVGATGRHAVIEITSERVVRENRNAVAMQEASNQPVKPRTVTRKHK